MSYTYDELCRGAKRNVKRWFATNHRENKDFTNYVLYSLEKIFGVNSLMVQYSILGSNAFDFPDDGFNIFGMIDAKKFLYAIDIELFSENIGGKLSKNDIDTICEYCDYDCGEYHKYGKIYIPGNLTNNCVCMADHIDIKYSWYDELEHSGANVDFLTLVRFEECVMEVFKRLCKMYLDIGYGFFNEISDDDIGRECKCNGWKFDENGNVI